MKITHGNTYSVNSVPEKLAALRLPEYENTIITLELFGNRIELSGEEWNRILDLAEIGIRHEVR